MNYFKSIWLFLWRLRKYSFVKDVITLAAGTVIGQAILITFTPLLTRLFSPEDFGFLALFTSIGTICSSIGTGRYELAIGLPEKDDDAVNIIAQVVLLAGTVAGFYALCIFGLRVFIPKRIGKVQLFNFEVVYLIPVYTFLGSLLSALLYWNQRQKKYKKISAALISQSSSNTLISALLGLLGVKAFGLIYGLIFGLACAIIFYWHTFYKRGVFGKIKLQEIKRLSIKYISFPKFLIFSDLMTNVSQQSIPILFSILFNSAEVGFFALANRMLRIPSVVLTSSVGNVFRNDAIDAIRETGNCRELYLSVFKKLVFMAVPIYIAFAAISPFVFPIIFGKEWIEAGRFAQVICVIAIFDFVAFPLNTLFYIIERKGVYMRMQFFNALIGIVSVIVSASIFHNPVYSLLIFALSNACFDCLLLLITFKLSGKNHKI